MTCTILQAIFAVIFALLAGAMAQYGHHGHVSHGGHHSSGYGWVSIKNSDWGTNSNRELWLLENDRLRN